LLQSTVGQVTAKVDTSAELSMTALGNNSYTRSASNSYVKENLLETRLFVLQEY